MGIYHPLGSRTQDINIVCPTSLWLAGGCSEALFGLS